VRKYDTKYRERHYSTTLLFEITHKQRARRLNKPDGTAESTAKKFLGDNLCR